MKKYHVIYQLLLCIMQNTLVEGLSSKSIDGGGWTLVRHVPAGYYWHRATDQLRGSDVYGRPCGETCIYQWSIRFNNKIFNQFLFATGDGSKWLIADKDVVTGSFYANQLRSIYKSSTQSSSYKVRWYRRQGNKEDPWVSLTDHHRAIGQGNILYGENRYGGAHARNILPTSRGANVFIRNHGVPSNPSNPNNLNVIVQSSSVIKKKKLWTTLPYIEKEYYVKFDVFPTIFKRGWSNVIHFSVNGDFQHYGDRIPAVFFHSSHLSATSNVLHICSAISGNKNHCYNSQRPGLRRNRWSTVEISQTKVNTNYMYRIHLDGVMVYSVVNNGARKFTNVKVYAGDPFYDAQPGFIRNLTVQNPIFVCPHEKGFCVMQNGVHQNSGVIKFNNLDGNTEARRKACLDMCRVHPGSTGCEVIWGQYDRGCYVHTKTVSRGNKAAKHSCWIFSKCGKSIKEESNSKSVGDYILASFKYMFGIVAVIIVLNYAWKRYLLRKNRLSRNPVRMGELSDETADVQPPPPVNNVEESTNPVSSRRTDAHIYVIPPQNVDYGAPFPMVSPPTYHSLFPEDRHVLPPKDGDPRDLPPPYL